MNNEQIKKAKLGAKTFQNFCDQFGNDVYAEILLDELFKGLIDNEIVFIFGEQREKGDQINHCSPKPKNSQVRIDESKTTQTSNNLGEKDRPDYP